MKSLFTLSFCLSVFFGGINAQTKHWVNFNNKNGTPYSIGTPTAFLTPKSVLRRTTYNIPVNQSDLPVSPVYINAVTAVSGVTVVYASKWLNGLVISVTNTNVLTTVSSFSFVTNTTPVAKYKLELPDDVNYSETNSQNKPSSTTLPNYYGRSYWQNKQLGLDCIHPQGFRGQGMTIAVLDAGFQSVDVNPTFDSLRARGGILGTRDFVSGGNSVYEDHQHGAACLSLMAALVPGLIVGSAPRADFWLLRTEDVNSEKIVEEYNWIRGAEFADSVGADILTTSLGYTTFDIASQDHTMATLNGRTAPVSIAANMAARKGMIVLNAAGNEGGGAWNKISVPGDADSICTVGAIDSNLIVANFSSRGPSADGRIKPDLSARGVQSWVSWQANGACEAGNGTSYATPILAGAIACFWQAHPNYNNIKVLDTLKHRASYSWSPNNDVGWGVPSMCCIAAGIVETTNLPVLKVTLTPNPFNSNVKINLPEYSYTSISIKVTNSLGALIKTLTPNLNERTIDCELNNAAGGIYFVNISTSHGNSITKIIQQ